MAIKTFLFIPVLLTLVSGCAGVGVLYPHDWYEINNPAIGSTPGHYFSNNNNRAFTCEQVRAWWGMPDDSVVEGDNETLV